jgi:hypothetical protein
MRGKKNNWIGGLMEGSRKERIYSFMPTSFKKLQIN